MAETHVVHVFATYHPGGPQVRTAEVIRHLPERYTHSILAMDRGYGCRARTPEDRVRRWLHLDELPPGRFLPSRLAKYVLAQEPDVVATYNWGAIETVFGLARRGFRAIVHHEEGFGPAEFHKQKLRRVLARRFVLPRAHAVVVPSRRLESIARATWKLRDRKVRYIPNGIDLTRFEADPRGERRTAAKAHFGLAENSIVVGSVGHLRPEKNFLRLAEAFVRLAPTRPELRLLLVGDGVERAAIEALLAARGLTARALLPGNLADPRPAYEALDVFVISSNTEQMPISLLEAMAIGRAVAATDVGDVAHMVAVSNRDGLVVDPERLPDAIARLVDDPTLRARLALDNHEHCASEYPIELCTQRYAELYEEARLA
ncbi:MAG: glycosyltransferase [Planctomycetes bacterium]|nr:glycosyltransferase [Planctomycetota bacterium]MCB9892094.1 glycosyltransferase [Planctomycetota bacterium]MCB9920334.1 glycosyltransferase [Planctomycetota bacterium]